jgi:hypothetical protein
VYRNIRRVREYVFRGFLVWSCDITPRCHTACCCRSQLYIQDVTECYRMLFLLQGVTICRRRTFHLHVYVSRVYGKSVTHNQKSSARHNICNCRLTNRVSNKIFKYIYSLSMLKGKTSLTSVTHKITTNKMHSAQGSSQNKQRRP